MSGTTKYVRARPGREGGRALIVHVTARRRVDLCDPAQEGAFVRVCSAQRGLTRVVTPDSEKFFVPWDAGQETPTIGSRSAPGAESGTTGRTGATGLTRW